MAAAQSRPIVFLSDFGYRNEWVGICHLVMARIAPASRVIDLSHAVPPLDVVAGALLLADSLPYMAPDAVVLAVVDPNVGRDREIAVEAADGRLLVGPDNGLLSLGWDALGGASRAVQVTSPDVVVEPVAPSFRARDVLCPAVAHLAAGMLLESLGPAVDVDGLARPTLPELEVGPGRIVGEVIDVNRFGNGQLNVRAGDLATAGMDGDASLAVDTPSGSALARLVSTYADCEPDEYGLMIDPRGWLCVIRGNPGNAAEGLGLQSGERVWISRPV